MGVKETVKQLWTEKMEKEYGRLLSKKKVDYDSWVKKQEKQVKFDGETTGETVEYILLLQKLLNEHDLSLYNRRKYPILCFFDNNISFQSRYSYIHF